ncbi:MAG: hypothetical protein CM15mP84_03150 [Cellvibrionales bacterium]|nr:MAG: hypothetical protein CM15mP84_03150 [Cellvibrionales bacterium]
MREAHKHWFGNRLQATLHYLTSSCVALLCYHNVVLAAFRLRDMNLKSISRLLPLLVSPFVLVAQIEDEHFILKDF